MKDSNFLSFIDAKSVIKDSKEVINNTLDYQMAYKTISNRLPCRPNKIYASEWLGWPDFFGR